MCVWVCILHTTESMGLNIRTRIRIRILAYKVRTAAMPQYTKHT